MTLRAKLRRNRVLAWLWRGLSRLSRPASPARMVTDNDAYLGWIQQFERPSSFKIQAADPLISIIVPVFNTTELLLTELVASVTNQTYDRWELVLADGSDDDAARKRCAAATTSDRRIKHLPLPNNAGIAGNTNAGIAAATGSFIAFLDHDDTLAPFALAAVVTALRRQPGLDVFYSDEDKLMADGTTRLDPLFKPDWSPDLFLAANYLAHFVVVRAELVRHIGGIRMGYDGAQDHDFLLRVFDLTDRIHHIPQLSYHWRATEGSTAQHPSEKSDAASAGSRVLAEYLTRNHIKGRAVDMDGQLTNYRLSYQAPPKARLRVAVLGGGEPPASIVEQIEAAGMVLVETRSDFTVFLNSAIEAPNSDWVGELVGAAAQKGRGLVGGFICDSKGTIVEAGYSVQAGRPVPLFKGLTPAQWTYAGVAGWPRNLVVPPINCCVVRTASIPAAVTDPAELAVRLHRQGLHNVAWPFVRLTLDAANTIEPSLAVSGPDPYLNPNLIVADGVPTLRS